MNLLISPDGEESEKQALKMLIFKTINLKP